MLSRSLHRARAFFTERVWRKDLDRLPRRKAIGYRAGRLLVASVRAFSEHDVPSRAAALTFYSVLAIVPLLAFGFSVLKGLGGYDDLVQGTLQPWVRDAFEGIPQLAEAFNTIFSFVAATNLGTLGAAGLVFLVYAAVTLLMEVARAFNQIWAVPRRRTIVRQVTDLVALIVLAPLALMLAISLVAAATATTSRVMEALPEGLRLRVIVDAIGQVIPVAIVFAGLTVAYTVLPHTRTRPASTMLGGALAAAGWYALLLLHVRFQIGVAKYSALYSGFAAIPIFLFWMYMSWLVVLIGAIVAATHQQSRSIERKVRIEGTDAALQEAVALELMVRVAHAFLFAPDRRWTVVDLADALDVPDQIVDQVASQLQDRGFIAKVGDNPEAFFLLSRPPELVHVKDILDVIRHGRYGATDPAAIESGCSPAVSALLRGLDRELEDSPYNGTIRDLVESVAPAGQRARPPAVAAGSRKPEDLK